jgi:hypothetical protein
VVTDGAAAAPVSSADAIGSAGVACGGSRSTSSSATKTTVDSGRFTSPSASLITAL